MSGTAVQRDAHVAESTCHCLNKHDECIIEAEMAMRGRFDAAGMNLLPMSCHAARVRGVVARRMLAGAT
jgi:hypothetical protein